MGIPGFSSPVRTSSGDGLLQTSAASTALKWIILYERFPAMELRSL